jgi:hypothetical protein
MQGHADASDMATKVWGTDINVADVRNQFAQFIQGFRESLGPPDADGIPKLADEPKYLEYLKMVGATTFPFSDTRLHTSLLA